MSSTGSPTDVLEQVSQVWATLDNLSQNDPETYRSLIQKQMKEGAEFHSPPELHACLCTEIVGPHKGSLYINICSWKRVPAPTDPSGPLPVCAGKLETDPNKGGCTVLDVALNPVVLQDRKKDKTEVYMSVLSFAQQHCGLSLSQQYTEVGSGPKGSRDDLHRRLGYQQVLRTSKQPDTVIQTPGDLLMQITSLRSETQDKDSTAEIMCKPAEQKKNNRIQVISTTFVQPQRPEYQLEVKTDSAGAAGSVKLTVELPKVCSMSDCQLRISQDDVLLEVEDVYYLLLKFPYPVNEDTASATFNKKNRRLTLRVDVS